MLCFDESLFGFGPQISRFLRRLKYGLRRHGLFGLVWVAAYNILLSVKRPKVKSIAPRQADAFDEEHGTNTSGIREIRDLDVLTLPAAPHAVRYGPSNAQSVRAIVERLQLDYGRFSFGCAP